MAVAQDAWPCWTWTWTGTLAAVRVVPQDLTLAEAELLAGPPFPAAFADEAQPVASRTAAAARAARLARTRDRPLALRSGQRARIGGLLSAPLIMPSAACPPQADSPDRRVTRAGQVRLAGAGRRRTCRLAAAAESPACPGRPRPPRVA